ncbi:hypothetical protein, partial [Rhodovulum sulfidophilum]|uniref:hypothetical protein n=1 Tax=Rhodovulum sulfidophilum TaxID=35806 RepID=UPI001F2C36BC
ADPIRASGVNRANRPDTRLLLKRYTRSFTTCYAGAIHTGHSLRSRIRDIHDPQHADIFARHGTRINAKYIESLRETPLFAGVRY